MHCGYSKQGAAKLGSGCHTFCHSAACADYSAACRGIGRPSDFFPHIASSENSFSITQSMALIVWTASSFTGTQVAMS